MIDMMKIDMAVIQELLKAKKYPLLKEKLLKEQNADIAELINELDAKTSVLVFRLLPKEVAVDVFAYLAVEKQTELSMLVNEQELKSILDDLFFDDKIDFLEEMPAYVVKRILRNSSETERKLINQFLNYHEDSAGSIMTIEFMDLEKEMTVGEALLRIRKNAREKVTVYTCYVTDDSRHLEGIVSLRDLVVSDSDLKIEEIMRGEVISVKTSDDKEDVARLIQKYDLLAIPVTDHENRLVGIITVDDIVDVIEEENTEDFHKMATIGKMNINLLDAKPLFLIQKRLPWLLVLVFMNILSGAGIALFEETINSTVALVFFLPLLIASGGNAGSQSATLLIRSLAVGDVKIGDWFRLLSKEVLVAVLLGIIMGLTVSIIGYFRAGLDVAIVVTLAMLGVVIVGSFIGASLPFIFTKLKVDPATASGPLVTSMVDIAGVIIYFSIATWYLNL